MSSQGGAFPSLTAVGGGVLLLLIAGIAYFWLFTNKVSTRNSKGDSTNTLVDPMMMMMDDNDGSKDPSESMEAHLARTLQPDSDHWDVIVAILCSPGMIQWSVYDQQRVEAAVEKRKQELQEEKTRIPDIANDIEDIVNAGGWDDEESDKDDNVHLDDQKREQEAREVAARKADEDRKAQMENLKIATGKATVQMEGLDDGIIGQRWVEATLQADNVWPPQSLSYFASKAYHYSPLDKQCDALSHPGIRRMLCIALGRLHSSVLNNHPELLAAGSQKRLDQTYFLAASEVRQRIIMLLNSALKVAAELGHPKLCRTVIETIAHFKIGAHPKVETTLGWFTDIMEKTYGMAPKLKLLKQELREHVASDPQALGPIIPPETVLTCNSQVILIIELERVHAEAFLRQKLAVCQQQGIPPQEALKSFREPWWFLVDGPKSMRDGNNSISAGSSNNNESLWPAKSILSYKVPAEHLALFGKDSERVLVQITPMIIPNISQKQLAVRMGLKTPSWPGTYSLRASFYSTEFLGADMADITFEFQCIENDFEEAKKDK